MSKKYDPRLMKDRFRYIDQMERKAEQKREQKKEEKVRGMRPTITVVDEASAAFRELSEKLARMGESAEQQRIRLSNVVLQMEQLEARRKAQEAAELAEGIEYVKRSLGIVQ